MRVSSVHIVGLLLFNLQLLHTSPISTGWTDTDVDVLEVSPTHQNMLVWTRAASFSACSSSVQVLLRRLEDSASEQPEREREAAAGPDGLDAVRELFSAKNLRSVRNDVSRKPSGCFGRRMDRIGAMTSLGCNTVGRHSESQQR